MKPKSCDCKKGYVSHELDGKKYCCACFDMIIEHSGNVKFDLWKLAFLIQTANVNRVPGEVIRKSHGVFKRKIDKASNIK